MFKFVRTFFTSGVFLTLLSIPLFGICQVDVPVWVDDIGGPNANTISSAVRIDKQNNIYVAGLLTGTADFDPTGAVYNLSSNSGSIDVFVAKYSPNGSLLWAVTMGGSNIDQANSLTVDINGNPTISGQFNSSDFDTDPGAGSNVLSSNGDYDAFVIKLNTNGEFIWSKKIGGGSTDYGGIVASDSQGNVVATIRYQSSVDVDGRPFTSNGAFNGLIIKYAPNGNLLWVVNLSDNVDCQASYVAVDSQDNIVACGTFTSNINFNPLGTSSTLNGNGAAEFIAKYNPVGQLLWVKPIYGTIISNNGNLCVNSKDDIFITAPFNSTLNFNPILLNPSGAQDIFLAKYSSTGELVSVRDIGGNNFSASIFNYGISASNDDNVYVSGYFSGTIDFNASPTEADQVTYHGQRDFFLTKYDEDLNYKWAFGGGSPNCNNTMGRNVAVDGNNDVVFTGGFCSTVNFSASACAPYELTAKSSSRDMYLGKYVQNKASNAAQITAFSVPQQSSAATIDQQKLKITVTVPAGTNVTALVPTIAYTNGVQLSPASGTPQNFTAPVTYTLTQNCSALNYTVEVVFAPLAATYPVLETTLSVNTPAVIKTSGDIVTYTAIITNTGTTANGTKADFRLGSLITFISASAVYSGNASGPAVLPNQGAAGQPLLGDFSIPAGGRVTIIMKAQIACNASGLYNSSAQALYLDPTRTAGNPNRMITAAQNAFTGSNTTYEAIVPGNVPGKNYNGGLGVETGEDVNTVPPPANTNTIAKTDGVQGFCVSINPAIITGNTPANGTITYQWQAASGGGGFIDINGAVSKDYDPPVITGNTAYRRVVTSQPCSRVVISNVILYNTQAPPAAPVVPSETVCANQPATFTVITPQPDLTYNWYADAGRVNLLGTGISFTTIPLTVNTTFYAEAVSGGSCISAMLTTVQAIVSPEPAAPVIANVAPVCAGTPITLNISAPQGGFTYDWYSTSTGGASIYTGTGFGIQPLATTTYYAGANNGSCPSQRTPVTVTVLQAPAPPVVQDAVICPGNTATLNANAVQGVSVKWYDAATSNNEIYTGNTFITPILNASTTYYAEAVSDNGGCISITRTPVNATIALQLQAPQVTVGQTMVNSVTFNWTAVPGATGYEISTDNGQMYVNMGNVLTYTVASLSLNQSVTLTVRAVGALSCETGSTGAATGIAANPALDQVFIPNMFTPNGDGNNDILYVRSMGIKTMILYVYDQWGEMIFRSNNQSSGWDGTYKGRVMPVGVYVYYVEAIMVDGQKLNRKGTITLLR